MNKSPPITREDQLIFQGLQRAIVEHKAFVKIDFKVLNRRGSPFFNPWENVLPLLVLIMISLTIILLDSLFWGIITLLTLSVAYALLLPYFLEPIMQNRVLKRIVPRIERFLIAWRHGGVVIVLAADPRFYCVAPFADWRQFTKAYFSDLIPVDVVEV